MENLEYKQYLMLRDIRDNLDDILLWLMAGDGKEDLDRSNVVFKRQTQRNSRYMDQFEKELKNGCNVK